LISAGSATIVRSAGEGDTVRFRKGLAGAAIIAAAQIVTGCSSTPETACVCPKPVHYDDATIKQITAALRALPSDSVLHKAMDDYEDERDSLRICRATHS
jgi:hypothetical protein